MVRAIWKFPRLLVIAAVATALIVLVAPGQTEPSQEATVLSLINQYRAEHQIAPVHRIASLDAATAWHVSDEAANSYIGHIDSLGRDPWTRMCDFGYCYSGWAGEITAGGYMDAQAVFDAWRNSPSHNDAMLGQNYTVVGVGQIYSPTSAWGAYWTLDFASYDPTVTPTPTPTKKPTATPRVTRTPTPTPRCVYWWRCRR